MLNRRDQPEACRPPDGRGQPGNRLTPLESLRIFGGATLGVAALAYPAMAGGVPVLAASFGASACLLFVVPGAPFSRPRNVIGGHVISAVAGAAAVHVFGCTWYAAAFAVGGAIVAMLYSGTLHPPAASTALIAVLTNQGPLYPLAPVAAGAILLTLTGMLYNHLAGVAAAPLPGQAKPGGDEKSVHQPSADSRL